MTEYKKTPPEVVRNLWDNMCQFWSKPDIHFLGSSPFGRAVVNTFIAPYFAEFVYNSSKSSGNMICDLGSGGVPQVYYHPFLLNRTIGVDISGKMLETNSAKYKVLADIRDKLPFLDNSFQLVTMFFVNRYVADQQGLFSESLRILKPGGRLVSLDFSTIDAPEEECKFEAVNIAKKLQDVKELQIIRVVPNGSLCLLTGKK